jgi:hypothetical protein
MNKFIIVLLMAVATLTACSEVPVGEFTDVEVKKSRVEEQCMKGCWSEYYVTLEKNGTEIEMYVASENMYKLFKDGNIVTVSYDKDYNIIEVTLPKMENKDLKEIKE